MGADKQRTAYRALRSNALRGYLTRHKLMTFSAECLTLISGLLRFEEEKRLTISDAIGHRWFCPLNEGCSKVQVPNLSRKAPAKSLSTKMLFGGVLQEFIGITSCYQYNLVEWSQLHHQRK